MNEDESDEDEEEREGLGGDDADFVDVAAIDAHWLQRELRKNTSFGEDAQKTVMLEQQILKLLGIQDVAVLENELVKLLEYENFDFLRKLTKNRTRVLFCTRLKQSQSEEAYTKIIAEMEESDEARTVLLELEKAKAKRDREKDEVGKVKKEARELLKRKKDEEEVVDTAGGGMGAEGVFEQEKKLQPSKVLDLEALAFEKGGHTMTNQRCNLSEGATRKQGKAWEEIHIPHPPFPDLAPGEELIPVSALPKFAQHAFRDDKGQFLMKHFNRVQSKVFDVAFRQFNENMLICAPTGAGKTNIAMLAMLNVITNYKKVVQSTGEDQDKLVVDKDAFKIVYIAPMKALVQQLVGFFAQRFEAYGLAVGELSGDSSLTRGQIAQTQILVTTPEKWDIITRKVAGAGGNILLGVEVLLAVGASFEVLNRVQKTQASSSSFLVY